MEQTEEALTSRMQQVISGDDAQLRQLPPLDLASLHVVSQVKASKTHKSTLETTSFFQS